MTAPVFGTRVIGETEKALSALLRQQLAGTGITEPQWVTLTLAAAGGTTIDHDQLVAQVTDALKVSEAAAAEHIAELTTAGLLIVGDAASVSVAATARAQWTSVRSTIARITEGLWGDLPAEDLTTAARVLTTVLTRTNALLAAA